MEVASVPVEFTLEELWMLHDFIRHDPSAVSRDRWPTVSTDLNEDIALAVVACESGGLKSYTLTMTRGDMLVVDHHVRRDAKTPEGAKGKEILLKVFKARHDLAFGPTADDADELSYKAAMAKVESEKDQEVHEDAETSDRTDDEAGADEVAV